MKLREISVDDWEAFKDLLTDLLKEDPPVALELEPLIAKGPLWIAQFPKGKLGHFLIAEGKSKILGFCYIAVPTYYRPMGYIGIGISPHARRDGLGSQLFYEIALWAARNQLMYIIADVWNWNQSSLRFFSHLGFVEKSRFKDLYKGEQKIKVRMVKKI